MIVERVTAMEGIATRLQPLVPLLVDAHHHLYETLYGAAEKTHS